eukprot:sb/3476974/
MLKRTENNILFVMRVACLGEPTDTSKQPIRTRYLGCVTGYQPIRESECSGNIFCDTSRGCYDLTLLLRRSKHSLTRQSRGAVTNSIPDQIWVSRRCKGTHRCTLVSSTLHQS